MYKADHSLKKIIKEVLQMKIHTNIRKVLVPVPLTHDLTTPLRQALYFHEVYGSQIILLNVIPDISFFKSFLQRERLEKRTKRAMKKLKMLVKKYFKGNIPKHIKFRVTNGDLISSILKLSEQTGSDLIIIKKAKRITGRFRFFKKDNADRLIAEAICPVLTLIDKPTEKGINDILIPVDITKKISNKVAWAISLAQKFKAKIHIVSVQNLDIKQINSLSYKKSLEIEEFISKEGLEVNMTILKANNKPMEEVVLSHAATIKPDMMLIMTHTESILFDNYMGNFASDIIHKSQIPVFSVVPRKETLLDGFMSSSSFRKRQYNIIK